MARSHGAGFSEVEKQTGRRENGWEDEHHPRNRFHFSEAFPAMMIFHGIPFLYFVVKDNGTPFYRDWGGEEGANKLLLCARKLENDIEELRSFPMASKIL
ncbi:hypothetical protein VNO78_23942 [Psophocarpus tetragonolobus]|uniref:Uncharacterized protein n=1 Tax=Psophocarpus tetragonolobus TaxID=3891 RepID=A0AAN9S439_PSOTE